MPPERRRAMRNRDSGAVAVETALVSMLLLVLIFGIVETSFLFKDWLTVSAAARAGARMGSSEPRATGSTRAFADDSADQVTNAISGLDPANIQEVWVYKAIYATGLPASGASCSTTTTCVKYSWSTVAKKLTYLSGSWPADSQNACPGDINRDALGVFVKYKHSGLGFFFNNATVSESTVMWIEPLSTSLNCKP